MSVFARSPRDESREQQVKAQPKSFHWNDAASMMLSWCSCKCALADGLLVNRAAYI